MLRLACALLTVGLIVIIEGSHHRHAHHNNSLAGPSAYCKLKHAMMVLKYPCGIDHDQPFEGIDCAALYKKGITRSGAYQIKPFLSGDESLCNKVVPVYCDMETDGGGWTVFQRRFTGQVDFYRKWAEYQTGFGNAHGEYWLGNDIIHALTTHHPSELHVDLVDWKGLKAFAKYRLFALGGASSKYKLHIGGYSGTASDSLTYHNGYAFSTHDKDNDGNSGNCAASYHGAWWYKNCANSNLNGRYSYSGVIGTTGVTWYGWKNKWEALMRTEMKLRPSSFKLT